MSLDMNKINKSEDVQLTYAITKYAEWGEHTSGDFFVIPIEDIPWAKAYLLPHEQPYDVTLNGMDITIERERIKVFVKGEWDINILANKTKATPGLAFISKQGVASATTNTPPYFLNELLAKNGLLADKYMSCLFNGEQVDIHSHDFSIRCDEAYPYFYYCSTSGDTAKSLSDLYIPAKGTVYRYVILGGLVYTTIILRNDVIQAGATIVERKELSGWHNLGPANPSNGEDLMLFVWDALGNLGAYKGMDSAKDSDDFMKELCDLMQGIIDKYKDDIILETANGVLYPRKFTDVDEAKGAVTSLLNHTHGLRNHMYLFADSNMSVVCNQSHLNSIAEKKAAICTGYGGPNLDFPFPTTRYDVAKAQLRAFQKALIKENVGVHLYLDADATL